MQSRIDGFAIFRSCCFRTEEKRCCVWRLKAQSVFCKFPPEVLLSVVRQKGRYGSMDTIRYSHLKKTVNPLSSPRFWGHDKKIIWSLSGSAGFKLFNYLKLLKWLWPQMKRNTFPFYLFNTNKSSVVRGEPSWRTTISTALRPVW